MLRAPPTPLQGWVIKGAGALCELSCLLADVEMKKGPNQANSPSWLPCNDCALCWAGENIGQLSFHTLWGAAARGGATAGWDWREFELLWAVERRVVFQESPMPFCVRSNLTLVFMEMAGSAPFYRWENWGSKWEVSHPSSDSWKVSNADKVCVTPNSM